MSMTKGMINQNIPWNVDSWFSKAGDKQGR